MCFFRLGSTVVLVFEAPATFAFGVAEGQAVRVGERIGGVRDDTLPRAAPPATGSA